MIVRPTILAGGQRKVDLIDRKMRFNNSTKKDSLWIVCTAMILWCCLTTSGFVNGQTVGPDQAAPVQQPFPDPLLSSSDVNETSTSSPLDIGSLLAQGAPSTTNTTGEVETTTPPGVADTTSTPIPEDLETPPALNTTTTNTTEEVETTTPPDSVNATSTPIPEDLETEEPLSSSAPTAVPPSANSSVIESDPTEVPGEENVVLDTSIVTFPGLLVVTQEINLQNTSSALRVVASGQFCDMVGEVCEPAVGPEGIEPYFDLYCVNALSGKFEYHSSRLDSSQEILISPDSVEHLLPGQSSPGFVCYVWTRDYIPNPIQIK